MASRVNAATICLDRSASARARHSPERAYHALHPHLLAPFTGGAKVPAGMVVASVDLAGNVQTVVLPEGQFLIVGRHSRCGLRLDDDEVSLRHVVLRWTHEDGRALIRLWDLRAGVPFVTEDDRETGAVVAEELLFGSIGRFMLAVVPWGGTPPLTEPAFAWGALPERRFEIVPTARERTRVPQAVTLSHTRPPVVFGSPEAVPEGGVRTPAGRIEVEMPSGRTDRATSDEQLDRGLLFGRYDRCQLTLSGEERLSRVHLLLVRIGGELWAIDTASTHGTRRNGAPVSAIPLPGPTSLLLATQCVVRWQPTEPPSA